MSLACHARICSDDPKTKLALPEVKIGLLPGGGGTQRLPKLIGLQKSLDMMLTGKNIYPRQAKKIGLVDLVVNKNKLHAAALKMVHQLIVNKPFKRKIKKTKINKFLDHTWIGRKLVFNGARKKVSKLGGYTTMIKNSEYLPYVEDVFTINRDRFNISQNIKKSFDPKRILNPGKMYTGI